MTTGYIWTRTDTFLIVAMVPAALAGYFIVKALSPVRFNPYSGYVRHINGKILALAIFIIWAALVGVYTALGY
ncbi:MAG: hypothetical protein ACYDH2_14220 [Anaerolineaceae bacterium]